MDESTFPSRPSHTTVPFPISSVHKDLPPAPQPSKFTWQKIAHFFSTGYNVGSKLLKSAFYILLFFVLIGGFSQEKNSGYTHLYGQGKDQIAVLDLSGVITESSSATSAFSQEQSITPAGLTNIFEKLRTNPDLKAIVLKINSPGGSVTASEEIYQLIRSYRQILNVPIIASYGEVAASGGYYISLAADDLVANSTTLTGSIGVIMQTINYSDLAAKYGVKNVVIKSGANKNLLDPMEPIDPNQIAILQQTVDEAYSIFTNRVMERRHIEAAVLAPLADGRVLTGLQAQSAGLVDSIGTFNQAVEKAASQANLTNYEVVQYGQKGLLDSFLSAALNKLNLNVSLTPDLIGSALRGKAAYLYQS